ncbi:MAG TPA: hypothetical protein VJB61_11760, partial [Actinomycetota bacterium]
TPDRPLALRRRTQFLVKFYAVFSLQPAKTAWMPELVVANDKAGRRIAERWATTGRGTSVAAPKAAPSHHDLLPFQSIAMVG